MNSFAPWHSLSLKSVFSKLKTTPSGLVEREAKRRTQQFGANIVFRPTPPPPLWVVIASHIGSIATIVFVALAAISSFGLHLILLTRIFLVLAIAQTTLAVVLDERCRYIQEFIQTFAHSVTLVKRLKSPRARSEPQLRPVDQLVPGDIVVVSGGENIPADGRVIQSQDLSVDESMLTGEPLYQEKDPSPLNATTPLLDRHNMVYSSSVVTRGRAVVAVTATGAQTVVGSIAQSVQQRSRLLRNMIFLGPSVVAIAVVAITGVVSILFMQWSAPWQPAMVLSAFAAILIICAPYWQSIATTILEYEATRRLLRIGIIVKEPGTISRLGDVTTVCFDKTATITKGALAVEMALDGQLQRFGPKSLEQIPELLWSAVLLANDAMLINIPASRGSGRWIGDSTDCALAKSAHVLGLQREKLLTRFPLIKTIPFDTSRKWAASVHQFRDQSLVFVKGAPERVLARCRARWRPKGKPLPLTESMRQTIEQEVTMLSSAGKRVIGVATQVFRRPPGSETDVVNLEWMGMFVLSDPVRDDARLSLAQLERNFCRMVMLTGDHAANATTVGQQLGWNTAAITGDQLEAMNDEQLDAMTGLQHAFARVEPRQKERIISMFQRRGDIVLMTGDGVNDAYALQTADVGVAVSNATDVARNAARIIIGSDNLFSIVSALNEGRWIRILERLMGVLFSFTSALLVAGFITTASRTGLLSLWQVIWVPVVVITIIMTSLLLMPARSIRFRPRWGTLPWLGSAIALGGVLGSAIALLGVQTIPDRLSASGLIWVCLSIIPIGIVLPLFMAMPGNRRWLFAITTLGLPFLLQVLVLSDPWAQVFFGVRDFPMWAWSVLLMGLGITTAMGWLFVKPMHVYDPHS
ncbi:cation-transporting P-type ATPase [Candidatus Uhrbacteria bacterium]|nr:cation-transporting P-type ATPase [Candidatus Uhrbacteria bacterium]